MKIKKICTLIFCVGVLMIMFVGCTENNKSDDSSSKNAQIEDAKNMVYIESEMNELAKNTVSSLVNNDFQSVADIFDDTVASLLSVDALKTSWEKDIVSNVGEYVEHQSVVGQVHEEYFVTVVTEKFELGSVTITVTFDAEKKIAGLNTKFTLLTTTVDNEVFSEEVVTVIADDTMPLEGYLTLPKNIDNPPVVLLVHGSGATDKNETVFENAPFEDIAHGLAQQGIATLRYDKRNFIYAEKLAELGADFTLREEVLDDVNAAIELLRKDGRVNSSEIYVLGHSLGGTLTPAIASENEDLAGIISMAGTLRQLYEVSYDQNKDSEKTVLDGDYDEETVEAVKLGMIQVEKDIEILRGDISDLPNEQLLMGLPVGYQKSFKEYNGMNFIDEISLPILVLQGTEDFQIYADEDYVLWEETLSGRENAVLKLYENLNHMMMETNGKKDISEYQIKGTVHQNVIDDISKFILD